MELFSVLTFVCEGGDWQSDHVVLRKTVCEVSESCHVLIIVQFVYNSQYILFYFGKNEEWARDKKLDFMRRDLPGDKI